MTVDGWFIGILIVGIASTLICVGAAVLKKKPNDITLLAVAAVFLYVLAYLVGSIVRLATGGDMVGAAWEFWSYLVTAACIPIGGFYWALMERTYWSNYVLGAVGVTVVIMMARMAQIWYGQAGM